MPSAGICAATALRCAVRSATRSRSMDAAGAGVTFQTPLSAAASTHTAHTIPAANRLMKTLPAMISSLYAGRRVQYPVMEHYTWDDMEKEVLSETIARKIITGEKAMVAQ